MLWLLPISGPSGDGLQWGIAEQKTTGHAAGRASPPQATKVPAVGTFFSLVHANDMSL